MWLRAGWAAWGRGWLLWGIWAGGREGSGCPVSPVPPPPQCFIQGVFPWPSFPVSTSSFPAHCWSRGGWEGGRGPCGAGAAGWWVRMPGIRAGSSSGPDSLFPAGWCDPPNPQMGVGGSWCKQRLPAALPPLGDTPGLFSTHLPSPPPAPSYLAGCGGGN